MHRQRRQAKPVILIAGMTGTGKSTLARRIAQRYGLRYVSGGDALKAMAAELGYTPGGPEWWETPEGLRFLKQRQEDPEFDRKVDRWLMRVADEGNVVIDSWTMPWLYDGGFKIWLMASKETRAKRIAERNGISYEEALKIMEEKDEETKRLYKRLYGFDLGEDLTPFHLIVDTENLNKDEVFQVVYTILDHYISKNRQSSLRISST